MNKREKFLIVILAASVILLGGFKFLIEPKLKSVNKATAEYGEALNRQRQITDNQLKSAAIETNNEKLKQQALNNAKSFFPEIENDKMHVFFNGLAVKAGVSFDSFNMTNKIITQIAVPRNGDRQASYPAKDAVRDINAIEKGLEPQKQEEQPGKKPDKAPDKQPEDLIEMMTVSLQFNGGYERALALIRQINESGRLVRISSLNMTADEEGAMTISITAECFGISKLAQDELSKNTMPTPSGKSNPFT